MIPHRLKSRAAFTLIELLIVISIIFVMMALTFPFVNAMFKTGEGQSGQTTITTAVNSASVLSQRISESGVTSGPLAPLSGGDYSGTITLFTPQGEIRFCINDQSARDATNVFLEDYNDNGTSTVPVNGYRDIGPKSSDQTGSDYDPLNYMEFPSNARVAGVIRTGSLAAEVDVIAPPFALRFDEYGHLAMDQQYVWYDGFDYNGRYNTTAAGNRPSGYNPEVWNPQSSGASAKKIAAGKNNGVTMYKFQQPFERIEVVNTLILYDQRDFEEAGLDWAVGVTYNQLLAIGKPFFFNPHTGLVMKEQ